MSVRRRVPMLLLLVIRCRSRRRGRVPRVGKEAPDVVPRNDLHERSGLDVPHFDERRLERQNIRIVKSCASERARVSKDRRGSYVVRDLPNAVGKPSHWMIQLPLARQPFLLT